jgi:cell division initiation protein
MEDVDAFFAMLTDEYRRLCEEKEILEQKIGVLADKIEEYRNDENSLRGVLFEAKKLGDSIISKAKEQANVAIKEAHIKAESAVVNARSQIAKEQNTLQRLRKEVGNFKNEMATLYKTHLELLDKLPSSSLELPDVEPIEKLSKCDAESIINEFEQMAQPDRDEPVTKQMAFCTDSGGSDGIMETRVIEVGTNKNGDLVSKFGILKFGENHRLSTENDKQSAKKGIFSKR